MTRIDVNFEFGRMATYRSNLAETGRRLEDLLKRCPETRYVLTGRFGFTLLAQLSAPGDFALGENLLSQSDGEQVAVWRGLPVHVSGQGDAPVAGGRFAARFGLLARLEEEPLGTLNVTGWR